MAAVDEPFDDTIHSELTPAILDLLLQQYLS